MNYSNSIPIGSLLDSASESDSKSNELKCLIRTAHSFGCNRMLHMSGTPTFEHEFDMVTDFVRSAISFIDYIMCESLRNN